MTESLEDQLFHLRAEMAGDKASYQEEIESLYDLLDAIWEERGLTQALWARLAEALDHEEDETPIVYAPEFVTQSDLLKLERRVAKLERVQPTEPMSIPT